MEFFKQAFPIEDSVIHGPKGRYFLPVFATGEGKELTGRKVLVLIIVAVTVVALTVGVIGYFVDDVPKQFYEHTELISTMMGQTPQQAYEKLTSCGSGLVDTGANQCAIPGGVEFAGADFEVLLGFDENADRLSSVTYVTALKASPKEAARILDDVLGQFFHKSITRPDGSLMKITTSEIKDALEESEHFTLNDSRNITPNPAQNFGVSQYITELEAADYWEGRIGEYLVRHAQYYRDVEVRYERSDQNLYISIRQGVEADREKG